MTRTTRVTGVVSEVCFSFAQYCIMSGMSRINEMTGITGMTGVTGITGMTRDD